MATGWFRWSCILAAIMIAWGQRAGAAVSDVQARIASQTSTARLSVATEGRFRVRAVVDAGRETANIPIHVEVPATGPNTWPLERIVVLDSRGERVSVKRSGLEWQSLDFRVPATSSEYILCLADPVKPTSSPKEADRAAADPATGLSASLCRWAGGRRAALSLRFDDSHPSHLNAAMPMLDEYGFRGTFMVNPGSDEFASRRTEWEGCARQGRHEFANHTMHHRGAAGDAAMDREIGDASRYIWGLSPERSKLLALNLGGGTTWVTAAPIGDYLERYHLFHVAGSLGMDDVYGNRPAAFRQHLERHIERGLWCRAHFHSIGPGLASSEDNLRAALDIARDHSADVWVAGMADIYKYQEERKAARLLFDRDAAGRLVLGLTCLTDATLYDQPLTVELTLPEDWQGDAPTLIADDGKPLAPTPSGPHRAALFDLPPVTAQYIVEDGS